MLPPIQEGGKGHGELAWFQPEKPNERPFLSPRLITVHCGAVEHLGKHFDDPVAKSCEEYF
jgi:hypothetical protein